MLALKSTAVRARKPAKIDLLWKINVFQRSDRTFSSHMYIYDSR
jgi:hypothetical protein